MPSDSPIAESSSSYFSKLTTASSLATLDGNFTGIDPDTILDAVKTDTCFLGFTPDSQLPEFLGPKIDKIVQNRTACDPNPECKFHNSPVCSAPVPPPFKKHSSFSTSTLVGAILGSFFGGIGLTSFFVYLYHKFKRRGHIQLQ